MSEKPFKKLLGNRIYLELPKKDEESKIIVDENTKEALQKQLLIKMSRLTIYEVGSGVVDTDLKKGTDVLVDPMALRDRTVVVPLDAENEVLLVSPYDIIHIW